MDHSMDLRTRRSGIPGTTPFPQQAFKQSEIGAAGRWARLYAGSLRYFGAVKTRPSALPPTEPSVSYLEGVDRELRTFVQARRDLLARLAPEPVVLVDELSRTLAAGGKRLRPLFCYWGYRAGGGAATKAIARVGAALELLHTFAVIHDDVMDRSHLRRGEPTAYRRLAAEHAEHAA